MAGGAARRRFRGGLHRLRPDDCQRPGARGGVPPRRRRRRGCRRRARARHQMRALLALFRSRHRRSRIPRRDAARRQSFTRMARARLVTPRALGLALAALALAFDQAAKYAIARGFAAGTIHGGALAPFLDLALRFNRGVSFSLLKQDGATGAALLTSFSLG